MNRRGCRAGSDKGERAQTAPTPAQTLLRAFYGAPQSHQAGLGAFARGTREKIRANRSNAFTGLLEALRGAKRGNYSPSATGLPSACPALALICVAGVMHIKLVGNQPRFSGVYSP